MVRSINSDHFTSSVHIPTYLHFQKGFIFIIFVNSKEFHSMYLHIFHKLDNNTVFHSI